MSPEVPATPRISKTIQNKLLHVAGDKIRSDILEEDMRGQCYDGASNMAGARSGVQSVVRRDAPKAMYVHCAAHRLNISVVSACSIKAFKNAESCVGELARFFSFSPKCQQFLDKVIESSNTTQKAKKLKDSCTILWVERIDSYSVFLRVTFSSS